MRLIVRYIKSYDYTMSSYGRNSYRTNHGDCEEIVWDGESDLSALIREKERDFLNTVHPKTAPGSWDHCRHRIVVIGLSIGGAGGLAFTPVNKIVLYAKTEAEASVAS